MGNKKGKHNRHAEAGVPPVVEEQDTGAGSPSGSAHAFSGSWPCRPQPNGKGRRCTSSGTSSTSRPAARS